MSWFAALVGIAIPLALLLVLTARLKLSFGARRENARRALPLLLAGLVSAGPVIAELSGGPTRPWPYLLWFGAWCVTVLLALTALRAWLRRRFRAEWPSMESGTIDDWPERAQTMSALVAIGLAVLLLLVLGLTLGGATT